MWLDLARILVGGFLLGILAGWLIVQRPSYLDRIRPRTWVGKIKLMGRWEWVRLLSIGAIFTGLAFFWVLFASWGLYALGWELYSEEEYVFTKLKEFSWLALLVTVNVLPIFEEWIFRGILLEEIALRSRSKMVGVLLSSLVFAGFHLFNPGTYPAFALPLVGAGVLLGACYLLSGLAGAILAHNAYNTIVVLIGL